VAEFVQGRGFGLKYGDSVTGDTPVIVRLGGAPGPQRKKQGAFWMKLLKKQKANKMRLMHMLIHD